MERRPLCRGCGRFAYEIDEFRDMAEALKMRPDQYVIEYETTLDPATLRFFCTPCFLRMGCPVRTADGTVVRLA